jgi:SAM-dependent methyltransferase
MADRAHWEFSTEQEMWRKVVGADHESVADSLRVIHKIFKYSEARKKMVLEVGAGCGRLLRYATAHADVAIGVDYSWAMVHAAARHCGGIPRMCVVKNDGRVLPFGNDMFDLVYSFTCFQHMPDLETIEANVREVSRVLKPRGEFIFQTVIGDRDEPGRYDGYVFKNDLELVDLVLMKGFSVLDTEREGEWIWGRARK